MGLDGWLDDESVEPPVTDDDLVVSDFPVLLLTSDCWRRLQLIASREDLTVQQVIDRAITLYDAETGGDDA